MDVNAAATDSSAAAPDWSTIQRDILCPLCDYNLRGLAEPRCPECGHQFEWKEMLDEETRVHPYLFEHHSEQNLKSFIVTQVASLRSWRFWPTVRPQQKPNTIRLLVYWLLSALPILLVLAMLIAVPLWQQIESTLQRRRDDVASMKSYPKMWIDGWTAQYGSLEAAAAARFPMPDVWTLLQEISVKILEEPAWFLTGALVAWPWATLAALSVFQISMRRKQIKLAHVLRCVVYSIDCAWWVAIFQGLLLLVLVSTGSPRQVHDWIEIIAVFNLVLCGLVVYRLTVAYRHYLRFVHPEGTVLLSQAIVVLAFWKLFLMMNGL